MNILDENILASQRLQLRKWRVQVRQIGHDLGNGGMKDEEIIPLLHRLRRPTFFTRDGDFFRRELCHERYCLVWLGVRPTEVAAFIRRVLKHQELNTQAKRMGTVIAVLPTKLSIWRLNAARAQGMPWSE